MRRYQVKETGNHERWVISYADFITLLFAFFVVMYAISSVNEGKYQILSGTLQTAFNKEPSSMAYVDLPEQPFPATFSEPHVTITPVPNISQNSGSEPEEFKNRINSTAITNGSNGILKGGVDPLTELAGKIKSKFAGLIEDRILSVDRTSEWIQVQINNSILFEIGEAAPSSEAVKILSQLGEILASTSNPIQIEGHTDNIPIANFKYPSNWELSASRASAIVRVMSDVKVTPERLVAVGYGEYQPLASNNNPSGRRENRRVAIVISRDTPQGKTIKTATQRATELSEASKTRIDKTIISETSRQLPEKSGPLAEPIQPQELENGELLFTRPELPTESNQIF